MKRPKKYSGPKKKVDLVDLSLRTGRMERSLIARNNARRTNNSEKILKDKKKREKEWKEWLR